VAELAAVLGASGQECPLDPRDANATVGGTIAAGLSSVRRLRYGPLRDRVLEVRFASAEGNLVRGGGPTVKNVTGYDLPRLLVGSLGTIGVLTRVILRCQPAPLLAQWCASAGDPDAIQQRSFRPSAVLWDGVTTFVLIEGHPGDVASQMSASALAAIPSPPAWPSGPHRGRASVAPARVQSLGRLLGAIDGVRWIAEAGVGTVHIAANEEPDLAAARVAVESAGGWLLREAGAPGLDGFGRAMPNLELMTRVKHAFDPTGKLAPGRLPLPSARAVPVP
jgi:glycolate oxidase FAD binding subunit